jgi:hypothetical protein
MKRILVPTQSGSDWQRLLAKPKLHWKKGKSAMTTAACWEAADGKLPPEIVSVLESTKHPDLVNLRLLLAIPEWEVPLKGGQTASHIDVFALARNACGLVVLAIEAKVDEEFGPTLGAKRAESSSGQHQRIEYLHSILRLKQPLADTIRYQLLHRTASALLTAQEFHAHAAVMLVQSFGAGPSSRGREDYEAFCQAIEACLIADDVSILPSFKKPHLFLSWCPGEQRFRDVDLPALDKNHV